MKNLKKIEKNQGIITKPQYLIKHPQTTIMILETFITKFEEMCKGPYPGGATLMEIFVALNNPNITIGDIEGYLNSLLSSNHCVITSEQGATKKYMYQIPPSPFDTLENMVKATDAGKMFVGFIPILKNVYNESEKKIKLQKEQDDFKHNEMLAVQTTLLKEVTEIKDALHKLSISKTPAAVPAPAPAAPSASAPASAKVSEPPQNVVKVQSFTGSNEYYTLDMKKMTCTCPNFVHVQSKQNPPGKCKHLIVALENGINLVN